MWWFMVDVWWKLGRIRVGNSEGASRLKRDLERVCVCVKGGVRMEVRDEWFVRNSSSIYRLSRGESAANLCRLHGAQILCGEHFLLVRRTFGKILNAIKCCWGCAPNLCRLCGEQILCGDLHSVFGVLALLVLISFLECSLFFLSLYFWPLSLFFSISSICNDPTSFSINKYQKYLRNDNILIK